MRWRDLSLAAALLRRELQLNTRGAAFWLLAAGGALYALWRGTTPQTTTALACYQVAQLTTMGLGVVAVLLGGAAAGRDARERSLELVLGKPIGTTARLLLARFIATWLSLLGAIVIMAAGVFLGQLITRGTPWNVAAYGNLLARAIAPLGLAVAVGFTLATLFNPLAAAIAALCWVAVPLARSQMPAILDLTVTQHWPVAAVLTAALLALAISRQGIAIAGRSPSRRSAAWAGAGLFAAAAVAVLLVINQGEDSLLKADPVLQAISEQTATIGSPAPGFWLLDARKQLVGLSDFRDHPTVIVFWAPTQPASAHALVIMRELSRRYRKDGLRCIAVCIDRDSATLAPFAREAGADVAMLWDRGRHFNAGQMLLDSPLATAYAIEQAPAAFLVDEHRVLRYAALGEITGLGHSFERYLAGHLDLH